MFLFSAAKKESWVSLFFVVVVGAERALHRGSSDLFSSFVLCLLLESPIEGSC